MVTSQSVCISPERDTQPRRGGKPVRRPIAAAQVRRPHARPPDAKWRLWGPTVNPVASARQCCGGAAMPAAGWRQSSVRLHLKWAMSNADLILQAIEHSDGLIDAELARRTGIRPHQQVNQICR